VDCNRGGKVFKLKGTPQSPHGPNYVFHNSLITRLKYLPKGVFEGLRHYNNAIEFVPMGGPGMDAYPTVFGSPTGVSRKGRFTTEWSDENGYSIRANGDVVLSPGWPDVQRYTGYAVGPDTIGADPGFAKTGLSAEDIGDAFFATDAEGPCAKSALGFDVVQPNGEIFRVEPGHDVGAVQRDPETGELSRFAGPPFQPTLGSRAELQIARAWLSRSCNVMRA